MKKVKNILGFLLLICILLGLFYISTQLEETAMESVSGKQEELSRQTNKHSDVYAWLTVEGTRIDYPIIQHLSDDSYYLSHDIDGQPTKYGAIFTERINNQSFDDPVTIVLVMLCGMMLCLVA